MSDVVGGVAIEIEADGAKAESDVNKTLNSLRQSVQSKASAMAKPLVRMFDGVKEAGSKMAQKLATPFKNLAAGFKSSSAAASSFTGVMGTIGGAARKAFDPAIRGTQNFIKGFKSSSDAASALTGRLGTIGGVVGKATRGITSGFQSAWSSVSSTASRMVSSVSSTISTIGGSSTFKGLVSGAQSAAKAAASAITSTLSGAFKTVAGIASGAFVAVGAVMTANLTKAVNRADILNNFPKVMSSIGFSAEDASTAINRIKDSLDGLPSSTQAIASTVKSLAPLTGDLSKATDIALAMNNALLAGGEALGLQENAMEQYRQMLAVGKVDMAAWRSIQSAMPGQLDQMAKSLLGATAKSNDLYEALSDGTITFDEFNEALIALNKEGIDGFASFEEQARAATGGIQTAMANMGNRIAAAMEKIMTYFGVDTIGTMLNNFSAQFGGWATKIIEWIEYVRENANFEKLFAGQFTILIALAGAFAQSLSWIPGIGPMIARLTGPIGLVIGLFIDMWRNSENLRNVVTGIFEGLTESADGALPVIEDISAGIGALAGAFGDILAQAIEIVVPALISFVQALLPLATGVMEGIASLFERFGSALLPIAGIILAMVAAFKAYRTIVAIVTAAQLIWNAALTANPIGVIIMAIAALVAALVWFFTQTEIGKRIVETVWNAIKAAISAVVDWWQGTAYPIIQTVIEAIGTAWEWLKGIASAVWEGIKAAISPVVDWFKEHVAPTVESGSNLIVAVWDLVKSAATWLWNAIQPIFTAIGAGWNWLVNALKSVWETVGPPLIAAIQFSWDTLKSYFQTAWEVISTIFSTAWDIISAYVETAWTIIKTIIETAFEVVKGIFDTAMALISGDWDAAWEAIKGIFETVWEGIQAIVETVLEYISTYISSILDAISSIWSSVWSFISTFISGVWNGIKSAVSSAISFVLSIISSVLSSISAIWTSIWNGIKSFFSAIWTGIKSGATTGVNAVYNTVTGIKDRILGFFTGAGQWLVSAGTSIMNGLKDGILSGIENVKNAVSNGLSSIRNLLPFSPAKEGPFSGRGWTKYSGEAMMGDLTDGILEKQRGLVNAVSQTMKLGHNALEDLAPKSVSGAGSGGSSVAGLGYGTIGTVNIEIKPESLEDINTVVEFAKRLGVILRMQGATR